MWKFNQNLKKINTDSISLEPYNSLKFLIFEYVHDFLNQGFSVTN